MTTRANEAWSVATTTAHGAMKARLEAAFGNTWSWGDSAVKGDYLGGKVTPEAVVRIYEAGDRFIVELRFLSEATGASAADQLAAAKARTLDQLMAAIDAKDVRDAEPD